MLAHAPDGATIWYEVYDFTEPWKESESILLHHGKFANHKMWFEWVPILSTEYRVVVFDARGRGQSSIPPPDFDWSLEQFATDAIAVMDAVGDRTFHWVGTSFGSVVGEYVGAHHGDRLKTLNLVSPLYRFPYLDVDSWIAKYDSMGAYEFLRRDVQELFSHHSEPSMIEWHARQMASLPEHVAKSFIEFMASVDLGEDLINISVPTQIIAASKSGRGPIKDVEFMAEQIPNSDLITFEEEHHIAVMLPQQCAELVRSYIHRNTG